MAVPDWYEDWIISGTDETFSEWQERQLVESDERRRHYTERPLMAPGWWKRQEMPPIPPPPPPPKGKENVPCSVCGVRWKDHTTNPHAHNFVL